MVVIINLFSLVKLHGSPFTGVLKCSYVPWAHTNSPSLQVMMDGEDDWPLEVEVDGMPGRMPVLKRTGILVSSCKSPGSATLPRKRTPNDSPCYHRHHPPLLGLLGRSARRPSTQGRWPPQIQRAEQIWRRRCRQTRTRNPPTIRLNRPEPLPMQDGRWSRSRTRHRGARWAR